MSTISFRWNPEHTACAALTARGEIVAVVDVESADADPRQVAFDLLDAVLDRGQVIRTHPEDPSRRCTFRVGLYNPFSAEVSVGAVPETVTFTDHESLTLPAEGEPGVVVASGRSAQVTLASGRVLGPRKLSLSALSRVQAAHQAA